MANNDHFLLFLTVIFCFQERKLCSKLTNMFVVLELNVRAFAFPIFVPADEDKRERRSRNYLESQETNKINCLPTTLSLVDAEVVPAMLVTEQTYCAESEGCKAMSTSELSTILYPASGRGSPSSSRTVHLTSASGKAEYLQVNVTSVPERTSTVPPTGSVLDSLLYHERVASDETIEGRVGSAKGGDRIILWVTFQMILPSSVTRLI